MRTRPLRLWLLIAGSSVLQCLPFPIAGPVPLWRRFFCWFCLVPLLLAMRRPRLAGEGVSQANAAILAYACGVLWYLGNCYWIYQTMYLYGGLPKPVALGILLLFSLYLGLYHAVFGWIFVWLQQRCSTTMTLVTAPFLWVAVEFARTRITGFPWDLLGYTQVDNQIVTHLAPFGGVLLLSFIVVGVNVLIASRWFVQTSRSGIALISTGLAAAVLLQLGSAYKAPQDAAGRYATLLQENLDVGSSPGRAPGLSQQEKYRQFIDLSRHPRAELRNTAEGVPKDFIVWPEAPADFISTDPSFRSQVSAMAKAEQSTVVAGSVGIDVDDTAEGGYHEFGSAAVFDGQGNYFGRYDKIHRVPWGEYVPYKQLFFFAGKLVAGVGRMEPGTDYRVFSTGGQPFGIFICYESIFGDEVRKFVLGGAKVLINISDDGWYGDTGAPWQHLDMERMRAIENRRWILRDTNTGVTTAIDPHGRGSFTTPRHVRAAFSFPFAYKEGLTFYTHYGDWFAWICVAVSFGVLAAAFSRHRQRGDAVH